MLRIREQRQPVVRRMMHQPVEPAVKLGQPFQLRADEGAGKLGIGIVGGGRELTEVLEAPRRRQQPVLPPGIGTGMTDEAGHGIANSKRFLLASATAPRLAASTDRSRMAAAVTPPRSSRFTVTARRVWRGQKPPPVTSRSRKGTSVT